MNTTYERQTGRRIRILREAQNITQDRLAALMQLHGCDMTRSALAKIESGQRHLYADELFLLKKLLKVQYEDLLE